MKIKYLTLSIILFTISKIAGQSTTETNKGIVYYPNGESIKCDIFNEKDEEVASHIYIKNENVLKLLPSEIDSFAVNTSGGTFIKYYKNEYEGKEYFFRKLNSVPVYMLKFAKQRAFYFTSKDGGNELIRIRNTQALDVLVPEIEVAKSKYFSTKYLNRLYKKQAEINGNNYESYNREGHSYIGIQGHVWDGIKGAELNYTRKDIFNTRALEWHTKLFFVDKPESNSLLFMSGINFKFFRKAFQPYIFVGAGYWRIEDKLNPLTKFSIPMILPIPGIDFRINSRNVIKLEGHYDRISIGYMLRIK